MSERKLILGHGTTVMVDDAGRLMLVAGERHEAISVRAPSCFGPTRTAFT